MERLDLSLSSADDARLKTRLTPLVEEYYPFLHFTHWELYCVLVMHHKLCRGKPMTRTRFRDVMFNLFNISSEELIERMYAAIDLPNTLGLGPKTWAELFSMFLRGSLDEKILFCFSVYDGLNVGYVSRSEMVKLLRMTIMSRKQDAEDTATDLADILMRKVDVDRDGKMNFRDYRESVRKNPELLQTFGKCLPDRSTIYAILYTFTKFVSTMHHNYMEEKFTMSQYELNVYRRKKFSASE